MNVILVFSLVFAFPSIACNDANPVEYVTNGSTVLLSGRIMDWTLSDTLQAIAIIQGPDPDSLLSLASSVIQADGSFSLVVPTPPSYFVYGHLSDTTERFCFLPGLCIGTPRWPFIQYARSASRSLIDTFTVGDFLAQFAFTSAAFTWTDTSLLMYGQQTPPDSSTLITNIHFSKGWNRILFTVTRKTEHSTVTEITADNIFSGTKWFLRPRLQANQRFKLTEGASRCTD